MPTCTMREQEAGGVPDARLSRLGGHARTVIGQYRGARHYPGLPCSRQLAGLLAMPSKGNSYARVRASPALAQRSS
jgi:hypothetical protein